MKLSFKKYFTKFIAVFLLSTNFMQYASAMYNNRHTHSFKRYTNLENYSKKAMEIFNHDQEVMYNAEKEYNELIYFSNIVSTHKNIVDTVERSNYYLKNNNDVTIRDIYDSIRIFYNWLINERHKDNRTINLKALYERIIFYFFCCKNFNRT